MEDPITTKRNEEKLSACIRLALNLDNLFKLYSYRIIEHANFIELIDTEIENFKTLTND